MNQFSEELKNALNGSSPAEARLTESEKERIRDRIQSVKGRKPRNKRDVLPKTLTALVAACFIFVTGGIAATKLGYLEGIMGSPSTSQSSGLPFYDQMEKGDFLKGWELVRKTPNYGQSSLMGATFEGIAEVSGMLIYHDEKSGEFANKIVFVPDTGSAKLLPTTHGEVRELVFNDMDMKTVEKIYQLNPGGVAENVKIEITSYIAHQYRDKDVADVINFNPAVMEDEPSRTYTSKKISVDSAGRIMLNTELQSIYDKYSTSHDDQLLSGLDPFSVFLLYFYAKEKSDDETQYWLHNFSMEIPPDFSTVEKFTAESKKPILIENSSKLLKTVRDAGTVKEEILNDGTATIHISETDGHAFRLSKNDKGIWKISWLAVQ
ncbi:hypothetical protein A8F94_06805 [Bacillus sp. FJAT-27225]|uniref:hypothetical protein n=1 Tax=Bacillus sp. FJAT-27225 TaxID=1743144 RepID=UPI00080C2F9A|nr:hypothetical protein [Bacillus sp. FJAT-27225]OCA87563.1 hypothetical protein A8F94_06805 [Bacillus sp. FJAT-27225]